MPESKLTMVQSRLLRRVRELRLESSWSIMRRLLLLRGKPAEREHFINAITTNKTDFFREPEHFDLPDRAVLPRRAQAAAARSSLARDGLVGRLLFRRRAVHPGHAAGRVWGSEARVSISPFWPPMSPPACSDLARDRHLSGVADSPRSARSCAGNFCLAAGTRPGLPVRVVPAIAPTSRLPPT